MYLVTINYNGITETVYVFKEYKNAIEYFSDCLEKDYNIPRDKHYIYLNEEYYENGNLTMTLVKKSEIVEMD